MPIWVVFCDGRGKKWVMSPMIRNRLQFMNKFNKKLTISLPEEPAYTLDNQSPSVQESTHHDKQGLLQFNEYRDGGDSQFGDGRNDHHNAKLNFVEFEEFNVNNYGNKNKSTEEVKKTVGGKRNVVIEVPDRDEDRVDDRKFKQGRTTDNYVSNYDDDKFKQPPAPSKGSKISKVFVFPATPVKKEDKNGGKDKEKEKQKQKQQSDSKQQLRRSFERQRQQFYRQKSKLQKQILIKNGQIQMLHKLLTQNLSIPPQQPRQRKTPQYYHRETSYQQMQSILLQKDLQINELLEKISELSSLLTRKSEELGKKILEVNCAQSVIESLRNQLYIYERKDESEKVTKKFYQMHVDKGKEQAEEIGLNREFGSKGLESLYKRIQMVRMNRIQFDSRNKIKSDVSYSQTAKNRPKGAFDFKGKTFQAGGNLNKTKIY